MSHKKLNHVSMLLIVTPVKSELDFVLIKEKILIGYLLYLAEWRLPKFWCETMVWHSNQISQSQTNNLKDIWFIWE